MRPSIRFPLILIVLIASGCATNRTVTISTHPADAYLQIDGIERGHGPLSETFSFNNDVDKHRVTAKRLGYKDFTAELSKDDDRTDLSIDMKQQSRKVTFTIMPVPANVTIDGKLYTPDGPLGVLTTELPFTVDARGDWNPHSVTAERFGFQPQTITVAWTDPVRDYPIVLDRQRKDLSITTTPTGADVYLDEHYLGKSSNAGALKDPGREFFADPDSNTWKQRKLTATKLGYEPAVQMISWDGGKSDYALDLSAKSKTLHIMTDPPGAVVTLDGKELPRDASGASLVDKVDFPPDDKGNLKVFTGIARKKTADSEWEPLPFTISWDNGKSDYTLTLKEILTRPVSLLEAVWEHGDEGWTVMPKERMTIGMKSTSEGVKGRVPTMLTHLGKAVTIDTLEVSPDGTQLLFTVLSGKDHATFHSRMTMVRTDGTGGVDSLSDGRSLDLTPSFSPAGDQIAFASDRFGRRLSICSMAANGAPGIRQLTSGDNNVLWPSIDSEPQPRLFYQSFVDTFSNPEIWSSQIGTTIRSDLQVSGMQPRIGPRDDAVIYVGVNEKTGKREIYRVSDKGGVPENLTASPDDDEFDPAWSKDGSKIAFAGERGGTGATGSTDTKNADIWVLDVKNPSQPMQITSNESIDDHPVWDPSGEFIYFRSNRGGEWGIWKIAVR